MSSNPPTSFRNPLYFPSFTACPSEDVLDLGFYHATDETFYKPIRHWCLLAEIISVEHFLRLRLVVKDNFGQQAIVAFYLDNDAELPRNVKRGDTIAVLYANQHRFLDGTVGLRIEGASVVQVCVRGN